MAATRGKSSGGEHGLADAAVALQVALSERLARPQFGPPVSHVYAPLTYARASASAYLRRYVGGGARVLLLGMNPGPFGMAQTGVPFGEVAAVRDWLGIEEPVGRPPREHDKRPVLGFACTRSEVSGRRLWGWAAERFGTPTAFFRRFMVWNYCPLVFLEEGGRNRTPDKLPAAEREYLFEACDGALAALVQLLGIEHVVGVGAFAEDRARRALADRKLRFGRMLHPSPASPLANRGWVPAAERDLLAQGIELP